MLHLCTKEHGFLTQKDIFVESLPHLYTIEDKDNNVYYPLQVRYFRTSFERQFDVPKHIWIAWPCIKQFNKCTA